jgi:hypothetical protein
VISQLARTIFGNEGLGYVAYVLTIIGAFAVLFMAANNPFADFRSSPPCTAATASCRASSPIAAAGWSSPGASTCSPPPRSSW